VSTQSLPASELEAGVQPKAPAPAEARRYVEDPFERFTQHAKEHDFCMPLYVGDIDIQRCGGE